MATDAIKKIDPYTIAPVAESQNRERNRDRGGKPRPDKNTPGYLPEKTAAKDEPAGPEVPAGQIVDSSTVVELLSHQPKPQLHARFLPRAPKKGSEERRKTDAKKLDKSA